MNTNFQITAIDNNFNHLFDLSEVELQAMGAVLMTAETNPGFPCRVSLMDAKIGEEVVLLPFQHHKTNSPYQATGPIYVRKDVSQSKLGINEIPLLLSHRFLSLRVYDNTGMMIAAQTTKGENLKTRLKDIFTDESASYIHVHNAEQGCYHCQVNRA